MSVDQHTGEDSILSFDRADSSVETAHQMQLPRVVHPTVQESNPVQVYTSTCTVVLRGDARLHGQASNVKMPICPVLIAQQRQHLQVLTLKQLAQSS